VARAKAAGGGIVCISPRFRRVMRHAWSVFSQRSKGPRAFECRGGWPNRTGSQAAREVRRAAVECGQAVPQRREGSCATKNQRVLPPTEAGPRGLGVSPLISVVGSHRCLGRREGEVRVSAATAGYGSRLQRGGVGRWAFLRVGEAWQRSRPSRQVMEAEGKKHPEGRGGLRPSTVASNRGSAAQAWINDGIKGKGLATPLSLAQGADSRPGHLAHRYYGVRTSSRL